MLQFQPDDGEDADRLPSLPGEDPGTENAVDAARWVRVYTELVALHEDQLTGSGGGGDATEEVLDQLRGRLDAWRQRHLGLAGMDFDPYSRLLNVAGRPVPLTRREAQLLDYLLERPGAFCTSDVLIREAWEEDRLAPEQVRTYVVRLRRKLRDSNAPADLINKPRLGYALNVEPGARSRRPRRAS